MWPFKNAQQERIDSDAVVIAQLQIDKDGLDATAKKYKALYSDEARKNANLTAENHRLTAKLACLTTRGPGGRFVKVDSAGKLISSQPAPAASVGAPTH